MKLQFKCPVCFKSGNVSVESINGNYMTRRLECGHVIQQPLVVEENKIKELEDQRTFLQKALRPYQREGVEFILRSNFRCLLADDMGLGKTIQGLGALEMAYKPGQRYVVICKSSLMYNWFREINKWLPKSFPRPIFHQTRSEPLPGFLGYIVSMDCLTSKAVRKFLVEFNPDYVIVDEAHNFKNTASARTEGLFQVLTLVKNVVLLSGTPLMNRLSEYWTMLNILRPEQWPSRKNFLFNWVEYDSYSKRYLGIAAHCRQNFLERTAPYVLRRTKSQVKADLPDLYAGYEYTSEISAKLKKDYGKILDEISDLLLEKRSNANSMQILSLMQKLWNICGLAKVPYIAEQAISFLQETDRKLCIGVHHKDVTLYLQTLLRQAGFNPIIISGADSAEQKERKEQEFRKEENRICIMSILAGGEGRNMQFCDTAFLAELYWVPAKLEQFKGRFHRIGSTAEAVFINTFLLADSIDEFFQNLLDLKNSITNTAIALEGVQELSTDQIRELAEKVISTRNKYV